MKSNWMRYGTTPVECPSWAISLDYMERIKQSCRIGSADNKGLKSICEQCGLCYSVLVAAGIRAHENLDSSLGNIGYF
ncbi:MAG TPA: hypothetical protein VH500_12765 [Nitrososphaeraceae archaeon]|jgi:hypothetical protein